MVGDMKTRECVGGMEEEVFFFFFELWECCSASGSGETGNMCDLFLTAP